MQKLLTRYKWPLVVFLAAFVLRLIHLIQYQSNPAFYYPMVDELWHLNWAREIISGSFWGREAYFRGPLYPYMLALFLEVTGDSIFWSRFIQTIIAGFSTVLVFFIGERVVSKKVGIIAALGYAAYGTAIFYETMFLIPVLFIFLNLLAVYLLLRLKGKYQLPGWLVAGFILGLAAVARPNILLLLPFFIPWIYFAFFGSVHLRKRLAVPAVYLLGVLLPISAVTIRNYAVTHEFILISSQGGVNLYIGNNPETEGLTMLMPEVRLDESLPWTDFVKATRQAAEKESGRKLTAARESSFWTKKALKFIWQNPAEFVGLTLKKILYLFVGFENSDQTDIYQSRRFSPILSILLWKKPFYFPFGLIFPLALIGMIVSWRTRGDLSLCYLFIIGYIPTIVLFLVTARHRLPLIPFLLIFAAAGLLAMIRFIGRKNWPMVTKYGLLFVVVLILSNRTYFDIGFENTFQTHFNLALTYEHQGRPALAEKEYRAALDIYPYSATTLNNLGLLLHRMGREDEALLTLNKAVEYYPDYAEAFNNIGLVYESAGDSRQAAEYYHKALAIDPDLHQAYINLGDICLHQDDFAGAEQEYLKAGEIAPEVAGPWFKLGALYARMREFTKAEAMFTKAEKLGPPTATDLVNWGNVYFSTRRPLKAIELYRRALKTDSTSVQTWFNLAVASANAGLEKDSVTAYLRKALQLDPHFEPARDLLERIGGN
jgi:Tfp pilus assembly protein PilF/4-amino-4-deoxy-L-arabinose transferase-like glycosyltransferase